MTSQTNLVDDFKNLIIAENPKEKLNNIFNHLPYKTQYYCELLQVSRSTFMRKKSKCLFTVDEMNKLYKLYVIIPKPNIV